MFGIILWQTEKKITVILNKIQRITAKDVFLMTLLIIAAELPFRY